MKGNDNRAAGKCPPFSGYCTHVEPAKQIIFWVVEHNIINMGVCEVGI